MKTGLMAFAPDPGLYFYFVNNTGSSYFGPLRGLIKCELDADSVSVIGHVRYPGELLR
jgi:hypothetical protein